MVQSHMSGGYYAAKSLLHLHESGQAEQHRFLEASSFEMPPLVFGDVDLSRSGTSETPNFGAAGRTLQIESVYAYILSNALLHNSFGVVTCGGSVAEETTPHLPTHLIPGCAWLDGNTVLCLPQQKVISNIPAGFHLMACNLNNYFHWLMDLLTRFNLDEFCGFSSTEKAPNDVRLLLPPLDKPWQQQSFSLLVPTGLPKETIGYTGAVEIQHLLYIPSISGAGWSPHPALIKICDGMRSAAYKTLGIGLQAPWRRLFIARSDSRNRILVNEDELFALAATAGFERVVLEGLSFAEQIRLFAEARHIIAPHGAGLTNLLFCQPGAILCELHMNIYVNWTFRTLAALRQLHYGCIIGEAIGARHEWVHSNTWHLAPTRLATLLSNSPFSP